MNKVVLQKPGEFRAETMESKPEPGEGEVRVQVEWVGLCGTDIHAYHGRQPFFEYPRILGHELGVVVDLPGPGVESFRVGDHCAVEPYMGEPVDRAFRDGKTNCSRSTQCLGVHCDGGMQSYICVPEDRLHRSNQLSTQALAMVEMLGIGHHAVERANVQESEPVVVVGLGPIGLSVLQFLTLREVPIIGVDMDASRCEWVDRQFSGVQVIQAVKNVSLDEEIQKRWGEGPQVVFDCTGNKESMEQSIFLVDHGGRIVMVGIYKGEICFSDPELHKKELSIIGSRNSTKYNFQQIIALMEEDKIDTGAWITHVCEAEAFPEEVSRWLKPGSGLLKGMLKF